MLDDPLVEALVAAAQQRQLRLGRELLDHAVVEQPPARGERDHAPALAHRDRVLAVAGAQRGLDDVDAQHHAGAAAERRVVDLPRRQRRVRAVVDRTPATSPSAIALATWRWPRNQSNHCGKSVKTSICTRLTLPGTRGRRRSARAATSTERTASRTIGTSSSPPSSRDDLERLARRQRQHPPHLPHAPLAVVRPRSPRARAPSTRPPPAAAPRPAGSRAARRAAPRRPRGRRGRRAAGSAARRVPARRSIALEHAVARRSRRAAGEQPRVGPRDVEGAVEPVRSPDPPGLDQRLRGSSDRVDAKSSHRRSTPRCRRARGGCP